MIDYTLEVQARLERLAKFDASVDPAVRVAIADLRAALHELHRRGERIAELEKELSDVKTGNGYESVVDMHRQYGREHRLRMICEYLEAHGAHTYAKNWAKVLREKFGAEDDAYDDLGPCEPRIAALEAENARLKAADANRAAIVRDDPQRAAIFDWLDKNPDPHIKAISDLNGDLEKENAKLKRLAKLAVGRIAHYAHVCNEKDDQVLADLRAALEEP